ncbi:MAG: DUF2339 domain-containing protein [Candidatus Taylorbacteria bacterium]|nr:DUF2339 domain-containing protein [Candidatus Taylorbacteria bacterium]
MFEIIIIVVVAIVLFNQNHRISRLEKLTEGKVVIPVVTSAIPIAPVMTQQAATQNVSIPQAIPTPQKPHVSSEEASGRFLGRIGIAAVVIGIVFFLKYAFDNNWVGPTGRVMIGVLAGIAFIALGQFLRNKYLQYSDLLIGGGITVLYLSVYSAHSFYGLIDTGMTGVLMFCVTALAFTISIVDATITLSIVASLGGFLTPFLVGSNENNMLGLFGYLTLLNLGVLGVSFFRKWPKLNMLAIILTTINFVAWLSTYYTENVLTETFFFLFITFIIFLIASIARAVVANLKADVADYFLLGADAFGFAVMSYLLLEPHNHAILGFGAVCIAVIYMIVAYVANKFNPGDKALNIFLPGLAVTFLSLAVPLQFSGSWVAVAWIVESVVLYFIASIISNRGFQVMGVVVYCLGLLNFFFWYVSQAYYSINTFVPIFNTTFAIFLLAIVSAYIIAYMYGRYGSITETIRDRGISVFVVIANILTIIALSIQITSYHDSQLRTLSTQYQTTMNSAQLYNTGYDNSKAQNQTSKDFHAEQSGIQNQSNTLVSILWALYAALLTAIGFAKRYASVRRLGLILFVVTGIKVVIDVWSLGQLYRIISFTVFGIIALAASFAYAKYKDRLKAIIVLALLIVSGLSVTTTYAAFNFESWQYTRSISLPSTSAVSNFSKIVLPPDISKGGYNFSDLRIINQTGSETAYLVTRNAEVKGGIIDANILNKSVLNGTTQFIVDAGEDAVVHTRLDLLTSSKNFKRQVSIYSSHTLLPINSPAWAMVTNSGYVFKFTDSVTDFTSGKNNVDFGANTARYLKVVVSDGVEGAVDVGGVRLYGDTAVVLPTYTKDVPVSVFNNSSKRATEITVDLGVVGYLTHAVTIGSGDQNYSRKVIVESSNDNTTWSYITQGYISNIATARFVGTANRIAYTEQKTRYIRVSVVNDDNMPLVVDGTVKIEGPVISAIFETKANQTYTLYYGNPKADAPVYDIARISSYIEENKIPVAVLGNETLNPLYKAPAGPVIPFSESHKWLLNALLVIVVILLGGGIGMYLKNFKKNEIVPEPDKTNQNL